MSTEARIDALEARIQELEALVARIAENVLPQELPMFVGERASVDIPPVRFCECVVMDGGRVVAREVYECVSRSAGVYTYRHVNTFPLTEK